MCPTISGAARFCYHPSVYRLGRGGGRGNTGWYTYTHDEGELLLRHSLVDLLGNTILGHLGCLVIGGNRLVGRHKILLHITRLKREDLLNTAVEEESNVRILLRLGNVDLLHFLLAEPFRQDIVHDLRLGNDRERVVSLVLCHGGDGELRVREVGKNRAVDVAENLRNLADTICVDV